MDSQNSTTGAVWWQEEGSATSRQAEGQGSGFGGLLRSKRSLDVATPPFTVSLRGAPTDRNVVRQAPSRGGFFLSLRYPDRLNSPFSLRLPTETRILDYLASATARKSKKTGVMFVCFAESSYFRRR